eukprot:364265-Chlamydomonas_euryale.AAC.10
MSRCVAAARTRGTQDALAVWKQEGRSREGVANIQSTRRSPDTWSGFSSRQLRLSRTPVDAKVLDAGASRPAGGLEGEGRALDMSAWQAFDERLKCPRVRNGKQTGGSPAARLHRFRLRRSSQLKLPSATLQPNSAIANTMQGSTQALEAFLAGA